MRIDGRMPAMVAPILSFACAMCVAHIIWLVPHDVFGDVGGVRAPKAHVLLDSAILLLASGK